MLNRPTGLLYLVIGCLLILSMPAAGHCESIYEQLENAAGHGPGDVPDAGASQCVEMNGGRDCPHVNKKASSSLTVNPTIAGMLAKQRYKVRFNTAQIQDIDGELQKCDRQIALANTIISKAQLKGKFEAEALARQNLIEAEKLKQSYLEDKRFFDRQLRQAQEAARKLSGALTDESTPAQVRGVVSQFSGEVSLLRADSGSKAITLKSSKVPLLEPGDEIITGQDGRAEMQMLGGRGAITMGENSKIEVQQDDGDAEVVKTGEGKFHFVVDKAEKFQADLDTDLTYIKETAGDAIDSSERFLNVMKAKAKKKFQVRYAAAILAIRGTEFVVNGNPDGSGELVVIEGKVATAEPDGGKSVMVETNHAVLISSEGKLSEVRQIDLATIPAWWKSR